MVDSQRHSTHSNKPTMILPPLVRTKAKSTTTKHVTFWVTLQYNELFFTLHHNLLLFPDAHAYWTNYIKAHPEVMAKRLTKKRQVKLVDQAAREIRIRLSRWGCTNRPFFHIVVADSKAPRNGRHYEQVWSFTRGIRH